MRGFLVGLGAGALLGLLFAPRSGEETREQLRSKTNDLMDSAKEQTGNFKATVTKIQAQVGKVGQQQTGTEEA